MKHRSSFTPNLQQRRHFITSAVIGGAASFLAPTVLARATEYGAPEACGELTAADPLYLYQTLVPRLQTSAITIIHGQEGAAQKILSDKIDDLYNLSTQLKSKLPRQSQIQPAADRLNSLAYIGRTNTQAVRASARSQSRDIIRAHANSQRVITGEIIKAAVDFPVKSGVTISDEAWAILQQVLKKIDDIKHIYQPAVDQAYATFDEDLKQINTRITAIQTALMNASTSVVRGDKVAAVRQVDVALRELAKLPAPPTQPAPAPANSDQINGTTEEAELSRDKFVEMLTPIKALINGKLRVPRISSRGSQDFSLATVAFVSSSEIILPNTALDPASVREIVRSYIPSGTWWQVVGVTAACLPLWMAYSQSDHRKSLIYSALTAVPRAHSKLLWQAAYFLNRLTA